MLKDRQTKKNADFSQTDTSNKNNIKKNICNKHIFSQTYVLVKILTTKNELTFFTMAKLLL